MLQEPVQHVKITLLLRILVVPAMLDTITLTVNVLLALMYAVLVMRLLVVQHARMVQEMIRITANALLDTMSPIKSVPSAI